MIQPNVKHYAHIGDALWELFVRERTILLTGNLNKLHTLTVSFVNAEFQSELFDKIKPYLSENESEIARRAGNIKISAARKVNRNLHRSATEFEALLGYNYLNDKERLSELYALIEKFVDFG